MIAGTESHQFIDPLEKGLVAIGLGNEDERHPVSFDFINERLFGIKTIAADDDFQSGVGSPYLANQPLTGVGFTILLIATIGVADRLW